MPARLPEGVYEQLLTRVLHGELETIAPARAELVALEPANLPSTLARHLGAEIERALRHAPVERQMEIADAMLGRLAELAPDAAEDDERVAPPPRLLTSIYRAAPPLRPASPLSSSTLLTRNRAEPAFGHEIGREIASADEIELIAAFITVGGVRVIRHELEAFARRERTMRVLTTVFTGTTEVDAIDALSRLPGVQVRISYDVRRTRLHAKAWLFARETGLHTAYVGSANLTATALGSGQEWMVKVCAADLPHVIEKFRGTFGSLWNDAEFEPYDPSSEADRARLRAALKAERTTSSAVVPLFSLRPLPFQQEILDRLAAERALHNRFRNLLVAATGTGKTVIAAFDYARYAEEAGARPRFLFVAHRRELLDQAIATLRNVLHDGSFGEVLGDGEVPERWEHVFATVQTAAHALMDRVAPDHFRYVVIDECHHAPADSYQRLVRYLKPDILVGLTATPERSDGKSLLPDFDDRIAAELRLWHALERQLLVPFEYYGISDQVDLTRVRWTRTGYHAADLAGVYTGNEKRVDLIVEQLRQRVVDLRSVRALAFCVSVEHAEYMAKAFAARGVAATAVHGGSSTEDRAAAPRRLERREINVLCTCDLYNEGVDLPFVDTLLLLRPTASATLFLQQIGRGLRVHPKKTTCLVLDFIGQHRAEFRFDELFAALTGVPRAKLREAVTDGFPFLPAGCIFDLDAVAKEHVLASLRQSIPTTEHLVRELRAIAGRGGVVDLKGFLAETGRDLDDVYHAGGWSTLLGRAGLRHDVDEETADLSRRLGWLTHTDEPARLRAWSSALTGQPIPDSYARRLTMLDFQLNHRGVLREPAQTAGYLAGHPAIRDELRQIAEILADQIGLAEDVLPVVDWPLALHRHYSRREIVAAVGFVTPGEKGKTPQGGILKLDGKREVLLVTLDKSASSFSPTTRYRDYAVSDSLFHWETQAIASVKRASGRRYVQSPGNGWSFHLFVRTDPDAAYAFVGPVRYVSHTGDRPIAITWQLEYPLPAVLFARFATLAQG